MTNEDYGRDLASVTRLLKALQGVEEMVDAHMEKVQGLVDTAKDFSSQGNFLAENIQQRVWEVVNRLLFGYFFFLSLLLLIIFLQNEIHSVACSITSHNNYVLIKMH